MSFSTAATERIGLRRGRKDTATKFDYMVARRADLHADARGDVFVELPLRTGRKERVEGPCAVREERRRQVEEYSASQTRDMPS